MSEDEGDAPKEDNPEGDTPKGNIPEGDTPEGDEATFTQADLDKKMAKSKRETKAAEKQIEDFKAELDKIAKEKMSDEEKVKAEVAQAQADLATLKAEKADLDLWTSKRQAAIKAGMSGDIVDAAMAVSRAVDEDDIAEALQVLSKQIVPVTPKGAAPGGQGGGGSQISLEDRLKAAHKSGDLATVLKIQNEIYRGVD